MASMSGFDIAKPGCYLDSTTLLIRGISSTFLLLQLAY